MNIRLCCEKMWPARKLCDAWGEAIPEHACKREPDHKGRHQCACGIKCQWDDSAHSPDEAPIDRSRPAPEPKPPRQRKKRNGELPSTRTSVPDEALPTTAYQEEGYELNPFSSVSSRSGTCRDPWERKCTERAWRQGLCKDHYNKARRNRANPN